MTSKLMHLSCRVALFALLLVSLPACQHSPQQSSQQSSQHSPTASETTETPSAKERNPDPWEKWNRRIFKFNDFADRAVTKPVARAYRKVVPGWTRKLLGNVFSNLRDVNDAVNNILQGKIGAGLSDVTRVVVNTTLGLGGLFDPASAMGLKDHQEDFGQTLAKWGLPPGPYVMIPLLGPGTLRDAVVRPLDTRMDPLLYLYPVSHRNTGQGLRLLDQRAGLLQVEKAIFGDPYLFIRDAYLQRRAYLAADGQVEDPFGDDF